MKTYYYSVRENCKGAHCTYTVRVIRTVKDKIVFYKSETDTFTSGAQLVVEMLRKWGQIPVRGRQMHASNGGWKYSTPIGLLNAGIIRIFKV